MLKKILLIVTTPLLFAQNISSVEATVKLNEPFVLKSSQNIFDNSLFYTHQPLLNCQPKLSAVYKIESEKKLKVLPRTSLQSSTTYQCSYKNESFKFQTEPLKLNEAHYFEHEKILRLSFNDAIDASTIKKGIQLQKLDKLSHTQLHYKVIAHDQGNVVLKITEKVGDNSLKLLINKELKTKQHTALAKEYTKTFDLQNENVTLDSEKKELTLQDPPQMVALENGKFALRLFLEDNLQGKSKKFIHIDGIEKLQVSNYHYLGYEEREKFGINNSYYYHDVTSDEFKANTHYKVTLKKGLNLYSRELKKDISYDLKTPNRAKAILFDDKKNYISSQGEVAFSSVNVDDATLVVERVLDDNLRYFINFANASTYSVENYTKEVFSKKITLNGKRNEIVPQKFKLSDLSSKSLPVGVYKISLHYTTSEKEKTTERVSSKILFISDLGISANLSKTQAFVSVLSLSSMQPIFNAEVLLYGQNNALIGTATTNGEGIAIIKNKQLLQQHPKALIVKTKYDKNFLLLDKSINSPMPSQILQEKPRFKAHIYFQSNILRPASKLHALITLKDKDFISASKLPVKLILRNPKDEISFEKVYHTDEYGLIDFDYHFSNSDKLGDYQLLVKLGEKILAKKRLKVEAFMPPKIENEIHTNKDFYYVGELIEANISSAYLFGAPAANLQGKVTLTARPVNYHNKNYQHYTFSNPYLQEKNVELYLEHSEDIVLDSQGKFEMALSTNIKQRVPSILEAMIGVTIMDDAQPVSSYKKLKLYPYKSMVGLKLDTDSFEKGEKLEGRAILIDPLTGKTINRELQAVVKQIHWHYNYSAGHYNWEKEINVVDTFTIQANEKFSRDISENGDYYIEVYDHLSGHSASASFDVWWWSYSNISPNNDLKSVEINFKEKLYQQGDPLEVTLKSPILEGKALITLESDKVEQYKLIEVDKGTAKVTLKIKPPMRQGLYLHATVYRASDTPSKLIPFRAMGYKLVKANREQHKIEVEMNLPEISTSKHTLQLKLKTSKPAKILVSVVDRAILQLVEQKTPDLFNYFNQAPQKQVAYFDLYDQLLAYIAEGKLVDFGAGDALEKKKKHLAPELGKRIKPFMFWSGVIDAPNKETTVNVKIPEFNGRASVVAIAVNQDSVGVNAKDIIIKDDIMLKPSYPLFVLKDDKIEVPLRIFNTTNVAKTITLSSQTSNNLALKLKESNLTIAANGSKKIWLELTPLAEGKGKITLLAHFDNKEVTKSVELPILSPFALSTKTFKGVTNRKFEVTTPQKYLNGTLYLTLSDNLIGALRDDLKYLVQYPYGCAEQTSSKLSAMHHAKPFLKQDQLLKKSQHYILEGIKKLDSMQNYYGEFYYWQGGHHVHAYASLYASQVLLELKRAGADVKTHMEQKIIKMLKAVATNNGRYDGKYSDFDRVYAAFILSEHQQLSASTANMLYEKKLYKKSEVATYYMAAILKMQGKTQKAQKLYEEHHQDLEAYAKDMHQKRDHYDNFGSNVRDMMLLFMIESQYFNKSAKDLELIQEEFSKLYSTQTKAIALKAISIYLGQPTNSNLEVDVTIDGTTKHYTKPQLITLEPIKNSTISIQPQSNAVAYSVEFSKNIERPLHNRLDKTPLSIKREFIDEAGDEVDLQNLQQGEKFYAKVILKNDKKINQVVVVQRIPACFTIVNNNIKALKAHFKDDHIDLEHKEIRDDRVLHFVNLTEDKKGSIGVLYTPLIASTIGECHLPTVITEAMYDTRIHAYAKEAKKVVVRLLKNKKPKKVMPQPVKKVPFKLRAKALVKELYTLEMSSQKATEFLRFYHYPLKNYFGKKEVSKKEILQDRMHYFKEFKKRTYTNMKTTILSSDANKTVVKISFDYKIDDGKKALTGTSNHQLSVIEVDGEAKIAEVGLFKAPTSSNKKKKTTLPLSERAISLVKELYTKEMISNDEQAFTSFFSYPVKNYFGKKKVSKEDILKDKKSYFKSWSNRIYNNLKVTLLSESTKEIKLKVTFDYVISNGKKQLKGKSKHVVTVSVDKDKLLISGIELYK